MMNQDFHYLKIHPNSKVAALIDFPNKASRLVADVEKWKGQGFNIGISTTKYNGKEALVVVDVDVKNGKNGLLEIMKLEMMGNVFPETYTQFTPSGGKHLVYRAKKPVKQGTDVLGKGLDIRSKGGYIVASGSTIDGKPYIDNGKDVVECPQWILDACGVPEERDEAPAPEKLDKIRMVRAIKRATEYLTTEAPVATEGQGGDHVAFKVAARVKDFGVGLEECFDLLLDHWNSRCTPPWSLSELRSKVENAYKYGAKTQGADAPEVVFAAVTALPTPPAALPIVTHDANLREVNETHALIFLATGHAVIEETHDSDGLPMTRYLPEVSFKRKYSNRVLPAAGRGRPKTLSEEWLDWEHRKEYKGLCFSPEKKPLDGFYNLWRGFTCAPVAYEDGTDEQRKALDKYLDHAERNVCEGNEALFIWLMGYFAHMIQRPYERPLTTLVFKGRKGTGKNVFVERIGNLLGNIHFQVAHTSRYLTGQFNGHLEACLCLVLDEAFWSGDKSAEGQLKGLTTAPKIKIERKGMESHTVDNLVRIVVIGNEEWLVPASTDERRYAVFTMGERNMQDTTYFSEMVDVIDKKGGNSLLLHYLKTFDLSKVNVNVAPKTSGLGGQKEASLTPFQDWWLDNLDEGRIVGSGFGDSWPEEIATDMLREAFTRYSKDRQIRSRRDSAVAFGRELRRVSGGLDLNHQKKTETGKIRVYKLPTLAEAREHWDNFIGHKKKWMDQE